MFRTERFFQLCTEMSRKVMRLCLSNFSTVWCLWVVWNSHWKMKVFWALHFYFTTLTPKSDQFQMTFPEASPDIITHYEELGFSFRTSHIAGSNELRISNWETQECGAVQMRPDHRMLSIQYACFIHSSFTAVHVVHTNNSFHSTHHTTPNKNATEG